VAYAESLIRNTLAPIAPNGKTTYYYFDFRSFQPALAERVVCLNNKVFCTTKIDMAYTCQEKAVPISDYAIIVNPDDNVAIVKNEMNDGLIIHLPSGDTVTVRRAVPTGHRFATCDIPKHEYVCQYGQPIGTSLGISKGDWITHDNMNDDVPVVRSLSDDRHVPAPDYFPKDEVAAFMGFQRADGRIGTRNFILIVPTSMCASHEATQISMMAEFLHYSRTQIYFQQGELENSEYWSKRCS